MQNAHTAPANTEVTHSHLEVAFVPVASRSSTHFGMPMRCAVPITYFSAAKSVTPEGLELLAVAGDASIERFDPGRAAAGLLVPALDAPVGVPAFPKDRCLCWARGARH